MKKNFLISSAAILLSVFAVACSDDDDPDQPLPELPKTSEGAYILNQGSYYSNVEGMLSFVDYKTNSVTNSLFTKANGRSLGNTPQCAVVYGSRIYIGVYASNTIEIINKETYESVKQISLENSTNGQQPRSMVARDGKVYISMYDGYLARLDTLSMSIDASVKVGPNPEVIAIYKDKIYVPNSDGMNYKVGYGKTASIVSLNPFREESTIEVPLNPCEFFTNGDKLFLRSMGDYGDVAAAVYEINADNSYREVAKATINAVKDNYVYLINAPYGAPSVEYSRYDVTTGSISGMSISGIDSPSGMGVDPVTGNIFIASYPLENGYASYTLPGYVNEYDANGTFVKKYGVGAGTAFVFFDNN